MFGALCAIGIAQLFVDVAAAQPAREKTTTPGPSIAILNTAGCFDTSYVDALRALGPVEVYDDTDSDEEAIKRLTGHTRRSK